MMWPNSIVAGWAIACTVLLVNTVSANLRPAPAADVSADNQTATASTSSSNTCPSKATHFQLEDPPYSNFFYSDCNTAAQVVVTTPLRDSNLKFIGPRLLVAWPAGNSGVVAFFAPENGVNGTLAITLKNDTGIPLTGIYDKPYRHTATGLNVAGVSGQFKLNDTAVLSLAILGSIRTMRDFIEGPSILVDSIQNAIDYSASDNGSLVLTRTWLDNKTQTTLSFEPINGGQAINLNDCKASFAAGTYKFTASFDYPQLKQLGTSDVLNQQVQSLIQKYPDQTDSLSFLSYTTKLLAGAWRFLTYFGRDSMISELLLEPVLSQGVNSSVEAVISAVLERVNITDGSAAHEETLGDYATYLNFKNNITSTEETYDYKMVDTDFYVPVVIERYFVQSEVGKSRRDAFFRTEAVLQSSSKGKTYKDLFLLGVDKIMKVSTSFAECGGQSKDELIHLKEGEIVGEWRDSTYGLGGGRIPYDVNTALVPAALRAIASLAKAGFFPERPTWAELAPKYAQTWEDETLKFFEVKLSADEAKSRLEAYVGRVGFNDLAPQSNQVTSGVVYHAVALQGNNGQDVVQVMNTDDCFRHFLLNTTNQEQLTNFVSQTADNILRPFPAGLFTDVGLLVANPAYGESPIYAQNFSTNAYHGTVVWSWQLAMMAAGLERQLDRCSSGNGNSHMDGASSEVPDFCNNQAVHDKVKAAYNKLWDVIEKNSDILSSEVWSWQYVDGNYHRVPLGSLPPPPGVGATESDIRQLWSLTFLAVKRNGAFR